MMGRVEKSLGAMISRGANAAKIFIGPATFCDNYRTGSNINENSIST